MAHITSTPNPDAYLMTADDLDALAKRIEFDERLSDELRQIAMRLRLNADCAPHPNSKAWSLLMAAKHGSRVLTGLLVNAGAENPIASAS
jgi:hypothetical protein